MVIPITKKEYAYLSNKQQPVSTDIFNIVQQVNHYRNFLIVSGSTLPRYNSRQSTFKIGEVEYHIEENSVNTYKTTDLRNKIIGAAHGEIVVSNE